MDSVEGAEIEEIKGSEKKEAETVHCEDYADMSLRSAKAMLEAIRELQSTKKGDGQNGKVSIAISGGNSVKGILENLSDAELDWSNIIFFMADERKVPKTSSESNYAQAEELLFSKIKTMQHPFDLEKGVKEYSEKFMKETGGNLDIILLGVGEDGHIASLFPDNEALDSEENAYIEVNNSPKPPSQRITLAPNAIKSAGKVILLFASETKEDAFNDFNDNTVSEDECPAKIILYSEKPMVFTVFGGKSGR